MAHVLGTQLVRFPLLLLRQAGEEGLDRAALLRSAGLAEEEIENPDARIPLSRVVRLWETATRTAAPGLGLRLGSRVKVRSWGLVGYAMWFSATLDQALGRLARYVRVLCEETQVEIQASGDSVLVVVRASPLLEALREPIELRLAALLSAAREITGKHIVPVEASLSQRPSNLAALEKFFGCPVRTEQAASGLRLRGEDTELAVAAADDTLAGYLDELAAETLRRLTRGDSVSDRVRGALWADISDGRPVITRVARRLGMSERSLQRLLRAEGTTFHSLLDDLRHEMAVLLLRNPGVAVYEIAYLLGYSEPATFHRAFRRWEGTAPKGFRKAPTGV